MKATLALILGAVAAASASGERNVINLEPRGVNVAQWQGKQSGIGSWFRTSQSSDATNGHSWCGYPYNNDTPGFAPDVSKMLGDYGGDYNKAAEAYCGLEAEVTSPSGKVQYLYLVDGFDPKYVRSYGSIDIIYNAFNRLNDYWTDDKSVVLDPVSWKFTGKKVPQYSKGGWGN